MQLAHLPSPVAQRQRSLAALYPVCLWSPELPILPCEQRCSWEEQQQQQQPAPLPPLHLQLQMCCLG